MKGLPVSNSDDPNVTELIEINLLFAQMELSLGAGDEVATLRALDHIMEALKLLRDEMPGVLPERAESGEQPDFA
ncbi:hypothetical protein M2323_003857 [Rhodoblastus acidophilus]|uniref:hypothetical protein n=1 Tax=Rhodoblastus acidophilus TaxID=1074 RepID=UPI0022240EA5|nr:hypothetical protein [Rhodoblastus acidophilus]MCW2286020.1 hypothetical protein [Rhodoblastus acidophilus]MCW2334914.1 hypothetical protein [Rhodoblastus acidophilus]